LDIRNFPSARRLPPPNLLQKSTTTDDEEENGQGGDDGGVWNHSFRRPQDVSRLNNDTDEDNEYIRKKRIEEDKKRVKIPIKPITPSPPPKKKKKPHQPRPKPRNALMDSYDSEKELAAAKARLDPAQIIAQFGKIVPPPDLNAKSPSPPRPREKKRRHHKKKRVVEQVKEKAKVREKFKFKVFFW
jgi:hypothetical protein